MTLTLYKNTAEHNRVDKSNYLTAKLSTQGDLRNATNLTTPYIEIESNNINLLTSINYAYLSDFKRYYYITEITAVSKNVIGISLKIDVLHTFREFINKQSAIISRTFDVTRQSLYLPDTAIPTTSGITTETIEFGFNEFFGSERQNLYSYLLTVI